MDKLNVIAGMLFTSSLFGAGVIRWLGWRNGIEGNYLAITFFCLLLVK